MRVLQAMAGAEYGGAEAFFTRLVPALHRAGLEQRVVIRRNERRRQELVAGGLEPIEVAFGGALDLASRLTLRRHIGAFKPDVLLTWMNRASRFCPRGGFVHVGRLGGYYDLKYYRSCDHLIANTQEIVDYLVEGGWPGERAHYLPNFVDGEPAAPLDRAEFYTPDRASLILAMGRLHPNKGFDVLLEGLARVPDAYLWIAGEGPLRRELEAQAQALAVKPRVRFLGWREDASALLAAADLFVCPSRHEPLGNVVIEAWAQSTPVVAADSLGPGTLIEDMDSGVLVPVDDAPTLGRAMRHVLGDVGLMARLGRQGRAAFEERFTEAIVVARYMQFFEQVRG
jgi:glycosyltransferase involved in cell wall biosynthesis